MRPIAILLAVNAALLVAGALLFGGGREHAGAKVKIGLVFDIGGKNDESFNTAAWRGLQRAQAELRIDAEYIEPSEGADRETAMRSLAARGFDLVIGVGFLFGPDLEHLAAQFPDVRFAGIDYSPSEGVGTIGNLAGLRFREQEGSFLVGAIAGLSTKTKVVGFVGGMKIPLIRKFEAGYTAGVAYVCPDCRVLAAYAGSEPKAFADPTLGAELAAAQYSGGADIIFHAAGKTGDGVFAAAKQRGLLAIGVDSDQYNSAPCCVMTSMIKRVDVATFDIIEDVVKARFRGGIHELGLKENGVGFVSDAHNADMLPKSIVDRVRKIGDDIVAGKIQVPDR